MFLKRVQDTKFFLKLNDVIKSPIFLGFYLSLLLISIIFGLDLIFYTFTTILLVITLLFLKDTYIIAALACVLYFSPSIKNNPGLNGDSIFYPHTYFYRQRQTTPAWYPPGSHLPGHNRQHSLWASGNAP